MKSTLKINLLTPVLDETHVGSPQLQHMTTLATQLSSDELRVLVATIRDKTQTTRAQGPEIPPDSVLGVFLIGILDVAQKAHEVIFGQSFSTDNFVFDPKTIH